MYSDSYKLLENGFISLSGESFGGGKIASEKISLLTGGKAQVNFKPIDEYAKKLLEEKLLKTYIENDEGFIIEVAEEITIFADTERAQLFAACSVCNKYDGKIQKGLYWNYPACKHRSIRIFLPPKSEMDYFYKLIDTIVHLGYNAILLEISGTLEFKRHPEVNESWKKYCESINETYDKASFAERAYPRPKNSIHTINGSGDIYSHEEMKEIVDFCRDRFVEIIPEVPSLTHSEYFLESHPELRECDDEPYASTCCPSNPDLYKLVFDFYDEVIEVFNPKAIHIGHDEFWVMCVCDKCKGKDAGELFAQDVLKCYNYLKSRGVETYMWGDKLTNGVEQNGNAHGGVEKHVYSVKTRGERKTVNVMGVDYEVYDRYYEGECVPDWVKEEGFDNCIHDCTSCEKLLPDDITYVNWYYLFDPYYKDVFLKNGKKMIYGNTRPWNIFGYKKRFEYGVKGFSISSWAETTEEGTQQWGSMFDIGYGSIISWEHERDERDHIKNVFSTYERLFKLRNKEILSHRHLEVTHTVTKPWAEGKKFCGSMMKCDKEFITIGNYKVTYQNGKIDNFPVLYTINVSDNNVRLERSIEGNNWVYGMDKEVFFPASRCLLSSDDQGIWYTVVYALEDEVENVEFIPKKGFEETIKIKEMKVRNQNVHRQL